MTGRARLAGALAGCLVVTGLLAGCSDPADEDFFASGTRIDGVVGGTRVDDGRLVMPHAALRVTGVDVTSELDERMTKDLRLTDTGRDAPDGQEFVLAGIARLEAPYDEGGSPTVAVRTAEGTHDITDDLQEPMGTLEALVVIAAVPEGSPVSLEIADEGRTASLDLRTGVRSEETETGATGAYYAPWTSELTGKLESTGVIGAKDMPLVLEVLEPDDVSIDLNLDGATTEAHGWLNGRGWAPEGRGFLVINNLIAVMPGNSSGCSMSWSPQKSMNLKPEGGKAVHPTAVDAKGQIDFSVGVAFEVPLDTRAGSLNLGPVVSTRDDCQFHQPMSSASVPFTLG